MPNVEGLSSKANYRQPIHGGTVTSPEFAHQTPAGLSMGYPHQHRSASYAAPPKFGNMSNRKSSGFKSSGQARFHFDDETPTRGGGGGGGGYRDGGESQALVSRSTKEDLIAAEWAERFSKMFGMVLGWCKMYVTGENSNLQNFLQASAPNLWQYICDVLYPNQPATNGASHACSC